MIDDEAALAKDADDRPLIDLFEADLRDARAQRCSVHSGLIDAGHPEMARSDVNDVLGLMMQGLAL